METQNNAGSIERDTERCCEARRTGKYVSPFRKPLPTSQAIPTAIARTNATASSKARRC